MAEKPEHRLIDCQRSSKILIYHDFFFNKEKNDDLEKSGGVESDRVLLGHI